MSNLYGRRVLLGVTGGIAAYKSPDLVRRLREAGAQVRVAMTAGAMEFVRPLTFQAVSGEPVHHDLLDPAAEAAMGHIELARWADQVLVAPASANFMARLAHGMADDLLTTLCLATEAPIALAPAMNRVILQKVRIRGHGAEIVDGDDFDVIAVMLDDRTQHQPADAAKSINRNPNGHGKSSPQQSCYPAFPRGLDLLALRVQTRAGGQLRTGAAMQEPRRQDGFCPASRRKPPLPVAQRPRR